MTLRRPLDPARRQLLASGALASLVLPLAGLWPRRGQAPIDGARAEALLAAVRAGDEDRVDALLAEDPDLARSVDADGRSALVLACVAGHTSIAEALLATGLELDVVEAVLVEDWPRFDELAEAEPASLNAWHPVGGTPLHAAALVGTVDMWRLRSAGCDTEARPAGGDGVTPARAALRAVDPRWAHLALTDLCSNGADVNAPQPGGSSVLHGAVVARDATLVRLAIRKGADVTARDDSGRTPAALAAALDWPEGVALLADADALPRDHRASRFARTAAGEPVVIPDLSDVPAALQSEVTGSSHMNLPAVTAHLARDPRLTFSISTDDELAIEASAHIGQRDLMRLHLDHGAPLSLPTAVSLGDEDAVKAWLDEDPRLIHERGAHDFPVMWYAVLGGASLSMAELLLARGVVVDQESHGATALHWCVLRDARDMAAWLIERGADVDARGRKWRREGHTPLELARERGRSAMAALLRDAGAHG